MQGPRVRRCNARTYALRKSPPPHPRRKRIADREELRHLTVQILLEVVHRHTPGRQYQRIDIGDHSDLIGVHILDENFVIADLLDE
jgi:hypothetical protein